MLRGFASAVILIPYKHFKGPEPTPPSLNLNNVTSICADLGRQIAMEVFEEHQAYWYPLSLPLWHMGSAGGNLSRGFLLLCQEPARDDECTDCSNASGMARVLYVEGARYQCQVAVPQALSYQIGMGQLPTVRLRLGQK